MNRFLTTLVLLLSALNGLVRAADITVDVTETGPVQGTSEADTIVIPTGVLLTDMGAETYVVYGNWGEDYIILRGGAINATYSGGGECAAILMRDYQQTPLGGDPMLLRQSQHFIIEDGSVNIVATTPGASCHGLYQEVEDVVSFTQVMDAELQAPGASITSHGDGRTYGVRQEAFGIDWAAVALSGAGGRIEATSDSSEAFGVYQESMLANSLDVTLSGANSLVRATGAGDTLGVEQLTTGHQNGSPSEGHFNVTLSGAGSRIEAHADTGDAVGARQHAFWATETGTTLSGAGSRIYATSHEGDAYGVQQMTPYVDTTHVSLTGHGAQIHAMSENGNAFGVWQAAGQAGSEVNLTGAGSRIQAESQHGYAVGIYQSYNHGASVNIGAGTTVSATAPDTMAYAILLNSGNDTINLAGSIVGDVLMDGQASEDLIPAIDARASGDDTFHLQRGARVVGTVDGGGESMGGSNDDSLYLDGGHVSGTFVGFENVYWSGALTVSVDPSGGGVDTMTLGSSDRTAPPAPTTVTVQSGARIAIRPTIGLYRQDATWTAGSIVASGGFSGQPALRGYSSPMLTFSPHWNNGLISVSVKRSSYTTYAGNSSLGQTLDKLIPIVGGELATALATIDFMPTPTSVSGALDQLDPSSTANASQSSLRSARHFSEAISARLGSISLQGGHDWNLWGVQDHFRDHDGDYDTDTDLLSAGADRTYGNMIVGLAVGCGEADGDAKMTDIDSEAAYAGLYMARVCGSWICGGTLFTGLTDTDSERAVSIGMLDSTATAQYDTTTYGASVELQRKAIQKKAFSITPATSVTYIYSDVEDIREEGAGNLSADINGTAYQQLLGKAGLLARYTIEGESVSISPRIGAAYFHSLLDGTQPRASFNGYHTYRFDLEEQDQTHSWGTIDAGVDTTFLDQQLALSLVYTGYFGDDYTGHAYGVRASYAF